MFASWEKVEREQVIFVLSSLKSFFADQERWIDYPEAVDENGREVEPLDPAAVRFSLMGASFKIAVERYGTPLANYIDCCVRELIDDTSHDITIGKMLPYAEEFAMICLALDELASAPKKEPTDQ